MTVTLSKYMSKEGRMRRWLRNSGIWLWNSETPISQTFWSLGTFNSYLAPESVNTLTKSVLTRIAYPFNYDIICFVGKDKSVRFIPEKPDLCYKQQNDVLVYAPTE